MKAFNVLNRVQLPISHCNNRDFVRGMLALRRYYYLLLGDDVYRK